LGLSAPRAAAEVITGAADLDVPRLATHLRVTLFVSNPGQLHAVAVDPTEPHATAQAQRLDGWFVQHGAVNSLGGRNGRACDQACYTVYMYSKIKRLRSRGERKLDREIGADPGTVGHMTVVRLADVPVASVYGVGSSGRQDPFVPMLFRAKLVSMHNNRMLLQGYERIGNQDYPDCPVVKQEWAVEVMTDQPQVPAPSERMG
jgi:hypothetical protein